MAAKKKGKKKGGKKKSTQKSTKKATKKAAKKARKKATKKGGKKASKRAMAKGAKKAAKRPKKSAKKAGGKKGAKKAAKGAARAGGGARAVGAGLAGGAAAAALSSYGGEGAGSNSEEESARVVPTPGTLAPDFTLTSDDGSQVSLSQFTGSKRVVLYFYPKDDTPGCTKEACDFTADWQALEGAGVVVLGVSPDSTVSHARFKQKYHIPFNLLSDEHVEVAKKYGAWGTKNMYGKISQGIIRSTFLIDTHGRVAKAWSRVRVEGHSQEVLRAIGSTP